MQALQTTASQSTVSHETLDEVDNIKMEVNEITVGDTKIENLHAQITITPRTPGNWQTDDLHAQITIIPRTPDKWRTIYTSEITHALVAGSVYVALRTFCS